MSEPKPLRLARRADGTLWATQGPRAAAVTVARCFPWTEPARFVSLRDADEDEFALVAEPAALDTDSRAALEEALVLAGFVLQVEALHGIDEEIEIRNWRVRTRQGDRAFQTPRDEWPREMPGGGLLIRDVAGDLFYIPDPETLDPDSQRLLWPFVD